MNRFKTYDATGVAPTGRFFAGDMNQFQDLVAALVDLAQAISVGSIAVGESGLLLSRFGAGELQLSGRFRTSGYVRAAGGIYPGEFTTATRDAILSGQRPGRLIVWNTTNARFEYNAGTDAAPNWLPLAPALGVGSITTTEILDGTILAADIANLQALGAKIADNEIINRHLADAIVTAAEIAASLKPSGTAVDATEALRALGTAAGQAAKGTHAVQHGSTGADPLPAASVSSAMLRNSGALSVIGRTVNSVGVPGDIAVAPGSDAVFRESGSALGFGQLATGAYGDGTITDAKLAAGLKSTGYGTVLPTTGLFNGYRFVLFVTDPFDGSSVGWECIYRVDLSATYPWQLIGAVQLLSKVDAREATNGLGTYSALATPGPSIALPRPGVYDVEVGFHSDGAASGIMSYDIGATPAVDADAVGVHGASVAPGWNTTFPQRKTFATALTLTAKYRDNTVSRNVGKRWMRVTPIRIS